MERPLRKSSCRKGGFSKYPIFLFPHVLFEDQPEGALRYSICHALPDDDRESWDHTCLPCRTTGFGEVSGFADVLENVQWESCHGPGRWHPGCGRKFSPVSEKQCLVCHNPAKSPNFDYPPYLAKVRCPASK